MNKTRLTRIKQATAKRPKRQSSDSEMVDYSSWSSEDFQREFERIIEDRRKENPEYHQKLESLSHDELSWLFSDYYTYGVNNPSIGMADFVLNWKPHN